MILLFGSPASAALEATKPQMVQGQPNIPLVAKQDGMASIPLKLIFRKDGQPTDVTSLEFIVRETGGAQVFPVSGRHVVPLVDFFPTGDKLTVGAYIARFTVGEAWTVTDHDIEWFYKFSATDVEKTAIETFAVLDSDTSAVFDYDLPVGSYISIDEFREEGFADAEDNRIARLACWASRWIDKRTGRWFEPRYTTFFLSGNGSRRMEMPAPIIEIHQIRLVTRQAFVATTDDEIDLDSVAVYNRHLRGAVDPDDREDPRVEFDTLSGSLVTGFTRWPMGRQNIQISGIFGYTDPHPFERFGTTPEEIRMCVRRLVARELLPMEQIHGREDMQERAGRVLSERAGDRMTMFHKSPMLANSAMSGDPQIDSVIIEYRKPMGIGSAGGRQFTELRRPIGVF